MKADIKGALENRRFLGCFEHRGQRLTKQQAVKILKYGLAKGYKTTAELSDEEVDKVLNIQPEPMAKSPSPTYGGF